MFLINKNYIKLAQGLLIGLVMGGLSVQYATTRKARKKEQALLNILNIQDNTGASPLINAIKYHDDTLTQALIQSGVDVNRADYQGKTPLITALAFHNRNAFYALLEAGANVNTADRSGTTPLMYAVLCEEEASPAAYLQPLIEKGADVNARNNMGQTALMLASALSSKNTIEYLIKHGKADTTIKDYNGHTAADYADLSNNPVYGLKRQPKATQIRRQSVPIAHVKTAKTKVFE